MMSSFSSLLVAVMSRHLIAVRRAHDGDGMTRR